MKKLMTIIGIIFGVGILVFSFSHSSSSQNDPSLTKNQIKELVGQQYPGQISELVLKTDANQPVYEVEVSNQDIIYEIKLDGHSGKVLDIIKNTAKKKTVAANDNKEEKKDIKEQPKEEKKQEPQKEKQQKREQPKEEPIQEAPKQEKPEQEKPKEPTKQKEVIKTETKTVLSAEEVGKIALKHFSGDIYEIELEEDDDRLIYEVQIERGEQEAQIEIDAYTGELILIEIEED